MATEFATVLPSQTARPSGLAIAIWTTIVALIAATFIAFGWRQWPGQHLDAALFSTPILNVSQGRGWIFDSYGFFLLTKVSQAYNWHGILHVFIYGKLLAASSYQELFRLYGLTNALTFTSYAILYRWLLAARLPLGLAASVLLAVPAGMSSLVLQGRPEQLIPLLLAMAIAALIRQRPGWGRLATGGVATGLCVLTSPLPGIMTGAGLLVFYALIKTRSMQHFLLASVGIAAVATATAALGMELFTPFHLLEWGSEMAKTGSAAQSFGRSFLSPRAYPGITTYAPLWNLSILFLYFSAGLLLLNRRQILPLLLGMAIAGVVLPKAADYSYIGLLAPAYLAWLFILFHPQGKSEPFRPILRWASLSMLASASTLWITGYIFLVAQFFNDASLTASLQDSAIKIDSALGKDSSQKAVLGYPALHTPSFVVFNLGKHPAFSTSYPRSAAWPYPDYFEALEHKNRQRISHYLLPQARHQSGQAPPANIYLGTSRFQLIQNYWTTQKAEDPWLLLNLRSLASGYNLAIYKRVR
jgi:hypothetical protein